MHDSIFDAILLHKKQRNNNLAHNNGTASCVQVQQQLTKQLNNKNYKTRKLFSEIIR